MVIIKCKRDRQGILGWRCGGVEIATLDMIVKTSLPEKAPSGKALRSDGEIPEGQREWTG